MVYIQKTGEIGERRNYGNKEIMIIFKNKYRLKIKTKNKRKKQLEYIKSGLNK
jgi:hypothetical protein